MGHAGAVGGYRAGGAQASRVTSDGGLFLVRELDQRLGFGELIAQHLTDSRRGRNTQLPLADLFRQSVYCRIAGYEDVNDAGRSALQGRRRLPEEKCNLQDQRMAIWFMLNRTWKFEIEILVETLSGGTARVSTAPCSETGR